MHFKEACDVMKPQCSSVGVVLAVEVRLATSCALQCGDQERWFRVIFSETKDYYQDVWR